MPEKYNPGQWHAWLLEEWNEQRINQAIEQEMDFFHKPDQQDKFSPYHNHSWLEAYITRLAVISGYLQKTKDVLGEEKWSQASSALEDHIERVKQAYAQFQASKKDADKEQQRALIEELMRIRQMVD